MMAAVGCKKMYFFHWGVFNDNDSVDGRGTDKKILWKQS